MAGWTPGRKWLLVILLYLIVSYWILFTQVLPELYVYMQGEMLPPGGI